MTGRPPCAVLGLALGAALAAAPLRVERPVLERGPAIEVPVPLAETLLRPGGGLFSFEPPDVLPLLAAVAFPGTADRGTVLRIEVLLSEEPDALSAQLQDGDGRRAASAQGFRTGLSGGGPLWAVLLPLPSDMKGGACGLTVSASAGTRSLLFRARLPIGRRAFVSESIELTRELADLRNAPDPRRDAEAVELWSLLREFHPGSLFERDGFTAPVKGVQRRSAFYADRREYTYAGKPAGATLHGGVDIAVPEGTEVLSCGRGRVVLAKERVLTGWTVVVEHLPGVYSQYYHMSGLLAARGDMVEKGQAIGLSGMTGLATGPHLHWEVESQGVAVDPDFFIGEPLLDKGWSSGAIIEEGPRRVLDVEGR